MLVNGSILISSAKIYPKQKTNKHPKQYNSNFLFNLAI